MWFFLAKNCSTFDEHVQMKTSVISFFAPVMFFFFVWIKVVRLLKNYSKAPQCHISGLLITGLTKFAQIQRGASSGSRLPSNPSGLMSSSPSFLLQPHNHPFALHPNFCRSTFKLEAENHVKMCDFLISIELYKDIYFVWTNYQLYLSVKKETVIFLNLFNTYCPCPFLCKI